MADGDALVSVTYHGLEIGTRLKLSEFGPTTAYLEHPTPLPVGTTVEMATEEGMSIVATVLRVHEQVSGGVHNPGMHVRAELSGGMQSWWAERVTAQDPVIPELPAPPQFSDDEVGLRSDTEISAPHPALAAAGDGAVAAPVEAERTEVQEMPPADAAGTPRPTVVMDAVSQEQLRTITEKPKPARGSTQIMSTAELAEITKHAGDSDAEQEGTDPGMGAGNGKPKRKKRRRSRKKT